MLVQLLEQRILRAFLDDQSCLLLRVGVLVQVHSRAAEAPQELNLPFGPFSTYWIGTQLVNTAKNISVGKIFDGRRAKLTR
jgi:hypothetical protein